MKMFITHMILRDTFEGPPRLLFILFIQVHVVCTTISIQPAPYDSLLTLFYLYFFTAYDSFAFLRFLFLCRIQSPFVYEKSLLFDFFFFVQLILFWLYSITPSHNTASLLMLQPIFHRTDRFVCAAIDITTKQYEYNEKYGG